MTYRNVATAIWTDDIVLGMSPEQKLIFLYLHTSPYTSACGIFRLHPKTMGFQIGLTHTPFESALRGLAAAFPDFVAVDWQTMEVGLLQYPRQLLIAANSRAMAIAGKDIREVKSQYLLRELISRNSAGLSAPYLAQLRRIQMEVINSRDVNVLLDGDLPQLVDNQQTSPEREIEIERKGIMSFSDENDAPPSGEKTPDFCAEIIAYLNERTKRKYRANTQATRKAISARLAEGYTPDDFRTVIDNRVEAWLGDAKMNEYLRPETLFRPAHFESYLNAAISPPRANTDAALRDCDLPPDVAERYAAYMAHTQEAYPALWQSATRIFSHCDYLDYWENRTIPAIQFHLTAQQKRSVMLQVHTELNASDHARKRYAKTIDAYHAAIRQAIKQQPIKI